MNHREVVLRMLQTGEQFSMDTKDLPGLAVKCIVLSLKYVDRRALFEALFPEQYADWGLAERLAASMATGKPGGQQTLLGDAEAWLCLLSLVDWPDITDKDRPNIATNHPPLSMIKAALQTHGLDPPGLLPPWATACRVLILQMIQGLQAMHALELLTSRTLGKNTRASTMQLLAGLYDCKHLPGAYLATLLFVLSRASVNEGALKQAMGLIATERQERASRINLRLKSMQAMALRPRLRDRLKTSLLTQQNKEVVDSKLGTWDSYSGWCHTHRFPNNLSDRVKRQLYFLASQSTWDWGPHVERLLPTRDTAERVQQKPVLQPDLNILNWVIEGMSMDGRMPFKEMMQFKGRCFGSFPVVYVQQMTLTQVLRLYLSAYQHPRVWKDVWKAQVGIISPQIVRDVEAFVAENGFAGDSVMRLMCGGELAGSRVGVGGVQKTEAAAAAAARVAAEEAEERGGLTERCMKMALGKES